MPVDFAKMIARMRGGFWQLGANLLSFAYIGTVFDPEITTHSGDSEEDNFDLVMQTAEKVYIIRPILRPGALEPIQTEVGKWCVQILDAVMKAFLRVEEEGPEETEDAAPTKDDSVLPQWLQKLAVTPKISTPIRGDDESLASAAHGREIALPQKPLARRRLHRHISDFGKKQKRGFQGTH